MYYYVKKYNGMPIVSMEDWIKSLTETDNETSNQTNQSSSNNSECCCCKKQGVKEYKQIKILNADSELPLTNISTLNDKFVIEIDFAGFEKENISVDYSKNTITVNANFADAVDKEYIVKNTLRKNASREIFLSNNYSIDNIKWNYKNGLVTIVINTSNNDNTSIDITDEDTEALYS